MSDNSKKAEHTPGKKPPMQKFSPKKKVSVVNKLGNKISDSNKPSSSKQPTHTINLKSFDAQRLWSGRKASGGKYAIQGCLDYSRKVKDICWLARVENDPYAFKKLIEIDRAYNDVDAYLSKQITELKTALAEDNDTGLEYVSPYLSPFKAAQYDVYFASGYGYNGARLLGKFDTIVVLAITAANCAVLMRQDQLEVMNTCKRKLRAYYELTRIFNHSGATCEDFKSGNAKAKAAIEKYGEIPDDIVMGKIKPKLVFDNTLRKPS